MKFTHESVRIDPKSVVGSLTMQIKRDVLQKLRRRGVVVGVSGGVDSAVVLALCTRALGPARTTAVLLPERESSPDSLRLGRLVADGFGVESVIDDITARLEASGCYSRRNEAIARVVPEFGEGWQSKITLPGSVLDSDVLNVFSLTVASPEGTEIVRRLPSREYLEIVAATNLKQRTRMAALYYQAEVRSYAVAGTANRNEHDQGFFVKYGDGGYDFGPIRHLLKTQVFQLAEYLDIPEEICRAVPTTDTYSAASSQEEFFFRMPFAIMDVIWTGLDQGVPASAVAAALDLEVVQVERAFAEIARKRAATEYLRTKPLSYGDTPSVRNEGKP